MYESHSGGDNGQPRRSTSNFRVPQSVSTKSAWRDQHLINHRIVALVANSRVKQPNKWLELVDTAAASVDASRATGRRAVSHARRCHEELYAQAEHVRAPRDFHLSADLLCRAKCKEEAKCARRCTELWLRRRPGQLLTGGARSHSVSL